MLDDPFADLERTAKPALLELLSHTSGSPQLVYLTDDEDVASWARLEALTGALAIIEPGAEPAGVDREPAATLIRCRRARAAGRDVRRWRCASAGRPTTTPRRSGRSTTPRSSSRR